MKKSNNHIKNRIEASRWLSKTSIKRWQTRTYRTKEIIPILNISIRGIDWRSCVTRSFLVQSLRTLLTVSQGIWTLQSRLNLCCNLCRVRQKTQRFFVFKWVWWRFVSPSKYVKVSPKYPESFRHVDTKAFRVSTPTSVLVEEREREYCRGGTNDVKEEKDYYSTE